MPKKVDTDKLAVKSEWNQNGNTFEERTLKPAYFKEVLDKVLPFSLPNDIDLTLTALIGVTSGEGSLCLTRGKRKLGYEIDLLFSVQVANDGTRASTVIELEVQDVCDYDQDSESTMLILQKLPKFENEVYEKEFKRRVLL